MAEPLTNMDINRLIADALGWRHIEEFMSHEQDETGYWTESGLMLSGYPPGEENETNVVTDWTGDATVALSLLQNSKTGGFTLRFNPMIGLYSCMILDSPGNKVADEYGKTAALACCMAWLAWNEAQS
jgi:hypothetical protein